MYAKPFYSELALVCMRVLAQVISAPSCERNCSFHAGTFSAQQDCTCYD